MGACMHIPSVPCDNCRPQTYALNPTCPRCGGPQLIGHRCPISLSAEPAEPVVTHLGMDETFTLRLSRPLLDTLRKMAERNERSVAGEIRYILRRHVEDGGDRG